MQTVIVGAGIAGLDIADKLIAAGTPGKSIIVIERNGYVGGRVITSKKHHVEIGAGRIHDAHKMVHGLLKRFKIQTIPTSGTSEFRRLGISKSRPNAFELAWPAIATLLGRLSYNELSSYTIRELLHRILGAKQADALLMEFPYRAEVDMIRADMGLRAFDESEGSVGSSEGYSVVRGGLSTLTHALQRHLEKHGVRFQFNTIVTDVITDVDACEHGCQSIVKIKGGPSLKTNRVILAIPATALRALPVLHDHSILTLVGMSPLTRIYATYPEVTWFGSKKLVTDSPLRYIIPVGPTTLMISYTDGPDTKTYRGLKGASLQTAIQRDLRLLFPERTIPEPTWIEAYEWSDGTTVWKPGSYDPAQQGKAMLQPKPSAMPNLFVCGESFSEKQAWIEGALEHAELLWTTHLSASV